MHTIQLQVFDCTLRDGEQQPMLCFRDDEKLTFAYQLESIGLAGFELMPSIDEHEAMLVWLLNDSRLRDILQLSTMIRRDHIDLAMRLNAKAVRLFDGVSPQRIQGRGLNAETVLRQVVEAVDYAILKGLEVSFVGGDSSRADKTFLQELLSLLKDKIKTYVHCDSMGILTPIESTKQVEFLSNILGPKVFLHYHNDNGQSVENVIQGVFAGAIGYDGTFLGIGERAGNVRLEKVLEVLRDKYNTLVEGINYDQIDHVASFVQKMCRGVNPPIFNSKREYPNISGIHAGLILRDKKAFGVNWESETVGRLLYFGKHSGVSNYRLLFGELFNEDQYKHIRDMMKAKSRNELKDFTLSEVIQYIGEMHIDRREAIVKRISDLGYLPAEGQ